MLSLIAFALLSVPDRGRAGEEPGDELREEFHQTYPLSPNGRVTLNNINGAVRIAGWDRPEVKVDAVKRAYTRERLDEATIDVNSSADGIDIRTRYPREKMTFERGGRRNPASVDYTLTIPRGARLASVELINGALEIEELTGEVNASSINGRVVARGLAGEVKLSTINGQLEAIFARLGGERIVLNSVNGQVILTIPSDASAQLKASSVHGSITNNLGLPARRGRYVGTDLAGQIGGGAARIQLSNVNGEIQIRHAEDNRPLGPVVNHLGELRGTDEGVSEAAIEREVMSEVRREMREAKQEIKQAVEEGLREADREMDQGRREAERERERAERDRQRAERDVQREQGRLARDAAHVQREAERAVRESAQAVREIESAMAQVERELSSHESRYGDKRFVERETKSFPISGTPRLRLETFDGAVSVKAWDKAEVLLNVVKRAGDEASLRDVRLRAEQQGADISIVAERDKSHQSEDWNSNAVVSLEVFVPRNANLSVKSGDGRLSLDGVHGEIEMETGDGSVDIVQSQGRLRVQTGDGGLRIVGHNGAAEVQTGDGRITLSGRFTQLSARTGDGTIWLELPGGLDANIETDAERVTSDGLAVAEGTNSSEQRVRRWRVGRGGSLFTLRTGDGHIFLRRAGSGVTGAAREK